jgi:CheY-like chemotaxis protein
MQASASTGKYRQALAPFGFSRKGVEFASKWFVKGHFLFVLWRFLSELINVLVGFYWACALVFTVALVAAARRAFLWRRRASRRDDEILPTANLTPDRSADESDGLNVFSGNETILVVEDEQVLRELLREILTGLGYGVLEAANGLEALQVWEAGRGKIDLLLTDLAMPHGVSGRELAAKLREQDPRLPVIFSSGHTREMIQQGHEPSPDANFLSKPYRAAELARMVRQALDAAPRREAGRRAGRPAPLTCNPQP